MTPARQRTKLAEVLDAEGRRQTWLADLCGVSRRTVWTWVHGIHEPDHGNRAKIALALGKSTDDLWPTGEDLAA